MKTHKAVLSKNINLTVEEKDYRRALDAKRKFRARSWNELFLKLLEFSRDLPGPESIRLMGGGTTAKEIKALREDIQAYLDELMEPCGRTPLDEALTPERVAKILHTGKMIKVVLQLMKEDAEKAREKR